MTKSHKRKNDNDNGKKTRRGRRINKIKMKQKKRTRKEKRTHQNKSTENNVPIFVVDALVLIMNEYLRSEKTKTMKRWRAEKRNGVGGGGGGNLPAW